MDKSCDIVPTNFLVRVQCFRKDLNKAVEGPSTRPSVLSMITGSYFRRRMRLTIFEPDEAGSIYGMKKLELGLGLLIAHSQ